MSEPSKPSRKHHFVAQAQLRHFAADAERRSIWVYDKVLGKSWISSLLNAGSENDFNNVELDVGRWNFEHLFQDVDGRSATLITEIISRRALSWIIPADHAAMIDLFTTQMLRTRLARTTPQSITAQMRELVRSLGYDPDQDPSLAMPTEASIKIGAVRAFLGRETVAKSMVRLVPALYAAGKGQRFIISDDPVIRRNAFAYGDDGLESHGIIVLLPIASDLALALVCPTIIARYEAIDYDGMEPEKRSRMMRYRDGFRTGQAITIEPAELNAWNRQQVAQSASQLYGAAAGDFDMAREMLATKPKLRCVDSRMSIGKMGSGPSPKPGMPPGLQLVIQGRFDHAILPIAEIDEDGEGLTARTTRIDMLELVAADENELRAELYDDGQARRGIGKAMIERFGTPADGWFRVVHKDAALRGLARQIDS